MGTIIKLIVSNGNCDCDCSDDCYGGRKNKMTLAWDLMLCITDHHPVSFAAVCQGNFIEYIHLYIIISNI